MPWGHRHLGNVSSVCGGRGFAVAKARVRVEHTGQFVKQPVRRGAEALLMLLRSTSHFC
jgi:hypothetical protein